jgi:hypothetical protein
MAQTQPASTAELVVCACRGKTYNARDLVDAAIFRGELDWAWKQFLGGVRAEERAEELDLEIDHDAIDAAAEHFRYAHDLITAEETEQWLGARALSLADFTNYFTRQHLLSTAEEEVESNDGDLISAPPEQRELFTADLIFSDALDQLSTSLMWRLAALAEIDECNLDREAIMSERKGFLNRTKVVEGKLNDWLSQLGRDQQWLAEMSAMEAAYRSLCEKVLTAQARQKQLATLRMPLTQLEAEVIEVDSLAAAKEALLCIQQDGMSMEEIATEARYPFRRITFLHDAVPEESKQKFWSAGPGDVLEPLPHGDGFELYRILQKIEPNPADPNVQQRVDERLLERHFSALASNHVEVRLSGQVSSE